MWAASHSPFPRVRDRCLQGATVVEFAIVLIAFLSLVFGVFEVLRAIYLYNILQDVTRRAATLAANANFQDGAAMNAVRQSAIYRDTPGGLLFGAPVTDAHVRIDYL